MAAKGPARWGRRLLLAAGLALVAAPAAAESWRLARGPSAVTFRVSHLVFAEVEGRFRRFSGAVETAGEGFAGATIEAAIDVASLSTRHRDRDRELRGAEFLDAGRFPEIRFASREVTAAGGDRYRILGDLTIRDVTREVVLDAELRGRRETPRGRRVDFHARTAIDRFDYGVSWNDSWGGRALVGETVEIELAIALVEQPPGPREVAERPAS